MELSSITVGTAKAHPGSRGTGYLKIGELADGSPVNVPAIVLNGARSGSKIWIQAMIHGNEFHGCLGLLRALSSLDPTEMSGAVIAIPALNIVGVRVYDRTDMDPSMYGHNVDLNLSFPGNSEGDFMEQAGNLLAEQIQANADSMIDLHSSGTLGLIWPAWCLVHNDGSRYYEKAMEMAKAFGLEWIVASESKKGEPGVYAVAHLVRMPYAVMTTRGIPSIIAEAGGGSVVQDNIVDAVSEGILSVLRYLKIVKGTPTLLSNYTIFKRLVDIKAKRGGIFRATKKNGDWVSKGEVAGEILSLFGEKLMDVTSPIDGVVLSSRTYPLVSTGTMLYHLGEK